MSETCTLSHYHSCPECDGTGTVLRADYEAKQAEITRLRSLLLDLVRAVGPLLGDDDRFQVMVGGNPIAVEEMLRHAREAYLKAKGV